METINCKSIPKQQKMNTILQSPTSQLADSLNFYSQLGFTALSIENPTLLSDGKAVVEINTDRFARSGVKLYRKDWTSTVEQLKQLTTVLETPEGYLLSDTSGTWVYLMTGELKLGVDVSQLSPSKLGSFAGISLETVGVEKSIELWECLGFSVTMGSLEQGWIALSNEDKFTVSLMKPNSCPHLFFNPSMTYFNGENNLQIIEDIRKLNIPITEEITHFNKEGKVDNIIIRDPGGFGFFLFSD